MNSGIFLLKKRKIMIQENNFNSAIYQKLPQLVLGFHGCDKKVAEKVLLDPEAHLRPSDNDYDWLGNGIYFWLNDPLRAFEWAVSKSKERNSYVKEPAVIGAIIDLGDCLNLCERESILLLQRSYNELSSAAEQSGIDFKEEFKNSKPDPNGFKLIRKLDCIVIRYAHDLVESESDGRKFDTVYGYFQEGNEAYPGAGILEKSHIQIAVRNTNCIKGYFLPRLK